MAKENVTKRQQVGDQRLREWEIPEDATAELLASVLGRDLDADLAVAHRLGRMQSAESAAVLQRLEHESKDKVLRKQARLGLYKLQQGGVEIPDPTADTTPVHVALSPIEGYLSPVDGRGDQMIWLVKARPGGVAHLFAVINDPEGLRETELNVITRKALKAMRQDLFQQHEIQLVLADWRYCDFLLQRAFEWARARGSSMRGDYTALRQQISREPAASDFPPLVLSHVELQEMRRDELVANSADLLKEKEFRTWFFAADTLQPYLDELTDIRDSPLVLDPGQQEERARAVGDRAVEAIFAAELLESWVRRLQEMAYVFWATGRRGQAETAVAVSLALADGGAGGRRIPLCDQLVRVSLGVLFDGSVEAEEQRSKSSVLVTPQQVRSESDRRRR